MKTEYRLSDFSYELPEGLIAKEPLTDRSSSRLMVINRQKQSIEHSYFRDIVHYLNPQDTLVLNDTRVFRARLKCQKKTGGNIEVLFLRPLHNGIWEVLLTGTGKIRSGLEFERQSASFKIIEKHEGEIPLFKIAVDYSGNFFEFLDRYGLTPLPPYITRTALPEDSHQYQTVFARVIGSSAAPTAGLHFNDELLQCIHEKIRTIESVTLHIGYGTFSPVKTEILNNHQMHWEEVEIGDKAARNIERTRLGKGRIFACGTTTLRALESSIDDEGSVTPGKRMTNLFIHPPMTVKAVDALITNFHLPQSTLLMLVCAFGGYALMMKAYKEAIKEKYRFYSYGDCMLIL